MAILEDEMGDGVMLQLYQQEHRCDRKIEDTIKLNSVCVIKEPYFKVMNDGGTSSERPIGLRPLLILVSHNKSKVRYQSEILMLFVGYGARVDHVNDIIWLAPTDDLIPLRWQPKLSEIKEANELKQEGNDAMKKGKMGDAVDL